MRLVQVVLEICNVCRGVVPVDWHEIDAASELIARADEVAEPLETAGSVADGGCAERGLVRERHDILHVCVCGGLGIKAGLDAGDAAIGLVEG